MSGMEVVAVVACVAGVVSAYKDGGRIVKKIKEKRAARKALAPTASLETSLERGPPAVEEAKDRGIEKWGPRYATGDKIAVEALRDILIRLQGTLLKHLWSAQEDDNIHDFNILVETSDLGRIQSVVVLHELYMRMAQAAPVPKELPEPTRIQTLDSITAAPLHGQGLPEIQTPLPTRNSPTNTSLLENTVLGGTSESNPEPKQGFQETKPRKKRLASWPRKRSSTGAAQLVHSKTTSEMTDRAAPFPPVIPTSTEKPIASAQNNYGGFCRGGYSLQVGFQGFKLRNQSVSMAGQSHYWACANSHCVFEGPARLVGKQWCFSIVVNDLYGVKYRWTFLAKSHVAISRAKSRDFQYQCVFCVSQGKSPVVYHTIDTFMEHVSTHRDQQPESSVSEKICCIYGRVADIHEEFDINLTPPEPAQIANSSALEPSNTGQPTIEELP